MQNRWTYKEVGYPYKLRGTNQQTDVGVLGLGLGRTHGASGVTPVTQYNAPFVIKSVSLHNRAGGSQAALGYGVRIHNSWWGGGQWVDATTTYTDDTTDAQDAGTADFPLETLTNSDGYLIWSDTPFNAVSLNITTASATGSPVRAIRFPDSTGAAWGTAISNPFVLDGAAGHISTGEALVVFAPPVVWPRSVAGLGTGVPLNKYVMNVRATTAPTGTAAVAGTIEIFRLYGLTEALADNGTYEQLFIDPIEMEGDALVALFGTTANDQNRVTVQYRTGV